MPAFEGTPGKSIAVALTLLAELGIFYRSRETGIDGLLSGIFGANNIFAGIHNMTAEYAQKMMIILNYPYVAQYQYVLFPIS